VQKVSSAHCLESQILELSSTMSSGVYFTSPRLVSAYFFCLSSALRRLSCTCLMVCCNWSAYSLADGAVESLNCHGCKRVLALHENSRGLSRTVIFRVIDCNSAKFRATSHPDCSGLRPHNVLACLQGQHIVSLCLSVCLRMEGS